MRTLLQELGMFGMQSIMRFEDYTDASKVGNRAFSCRIFQLKVEGLGMR